jgi:hypothetical protein
MALLFLVEFALETMDYSSRKTILRVSAPISSCCPASHPTFQAVGKGKP